MTMESGMLLVLILQVINALCHIKVWAYGTRFFVHIYCKNLEFLNTPVHIHILVVTMHEYKTKILLVSA